MKSLYRKVILLLLFLEICLPGRADTLIATKERPWHSADQVWQAVIVKDVQDRIGYIAAHDASGKEIQFNKSIVIVAYEIPELIPPKTFDKGGYARLQEVGKRLNELSESNPKIQSVLKAYVSEFAAKIQPEIQRFEQGDIKKDGIWITGAEYKAKIEAEQQRKIQEKLADDKRRIETIKATEERRQKEKQLAQIRWEAERVEAKTKKTEEQLVVTTEKKNEAIYSNLIIAFVVLSFAIPGLSFLMFFRRKNGSSTLIGISGIFVVILIIFVPLLEKYKPKSVIDAEHASNRENAKKWRDFAINEMNKSLKKDDLSSAAIWAKKATDYQESLDK